MATELLSKPIRPASPTRFPIVGVVTSAGGLTALKQLLGAVAVDCGMAFVLVPHLDPKQESQMVAILSRDCVLPVVEATDAMVPEFLAISAYKESLYAERAMRAGAFGYLNKQETNEKLIEAIRTVLKGERFLSDALQARLVASALGNTSVEQEPTERLSDREKEIFRLIGEGLTTGAIADQLLLSTHTIDTHREHLKRKLNVGTAAELSRLAFHSMIENS